MGRNYTDRAPSINQESLAQPTSLREMQSWRWELLERKERRAPQGSWVYRARERPRRISAGLIADSAGKVWLSGYYSPGEITRNLRFKCPFTFPVLLARNKGKFVFRSRGQLCFSSSSDDARALSKIRYQSEVQAKKKQREIHAINHKRLCPCCKTPRVT